MFEYPPTTATMPIITTMILSIIIVVVMKIFSEYNYRILVKEKAAEANESYKKELYKERTRDSCLSSEKTQRKI